ncbi:MAG: AtpZ/AtpI family protein [Acidimicrobiia bacterium]|nr:AtpZ/AtpI family protein [Acidimicrobiia bacterium]
MTQDRNRTTSDISGGWSESGAFLGSILGGTLLGYLGDLWLGTDPWLIVILTLVGAYGGFMRMYAMAKRMEEKHGTRY